VSIGVAVFPRNGQAAGALVRSADQALYAAKGAGRDQWRTATEQPGADSR
jgi:GGDEF domain-containing protein